MSARIIAPMTPVQTRGHGLGTPSLPQLLLTAVLRVLVELVLNVASTLRMRPSRLPAECHTDVPPAALPEETNDTCNKEREAVPQESHASPSPSVSLTMSAIHLPLLHRWRQTAHRRDEGELPPSVRSTGGRWIAASSRRDGGGSHTRKPRRPKQKRGRLSDRVSNSIQPNPPSAGSRPYAPALGRAVTRSCHARTLANPSGIPSPIHPAKSTVDSRQISAAV